MLDTPDKDSTQGRRSKRALAKIEGSNSLADLAARINAEHNEVVRALRSGIEHALEAGALLLEAKGQLRHGQWLQWLRQHCTIGQSTAHLYMRLARHADELKAKFPTIRNLTFAQALSLISTAQSPTAGEAEDAAMLDRVRAADAELMDEVRDYMERLRAFAHWLYGLSPEDRAAELTRLPREKRKLIPRWRKITDAAIEEAQWRISCLCP